MLSLFPYYSVYLDYILLKKCITLFSYYDIVYVFTHYNGIIRRIPIEMYKIIK